MPSKAVIDTPPAGGLYPSVREATVAMTERFGPKTANHIPPSRLHVLPPPQIDPPVRLRGRRSSLASTGSRADTPVRSRTSIVAPGAAIEPPLPGELLPSVRESTIAMTAKYGPKTAQHTPPSGLKANSATPTSRSSTPTASSREPRGSIGGRSKTVQRAAPEAISAARAPATSQPQPQSTAAPPAATAPKPAAVAAESAVAAVVESSAPQPSQTAAPASAPRAEAPKPIVTPAKPVPAAAAAAAPPAATPEAPSAVSSLLFKPVKQWTKEEVNAAAKQIVNNPVVMGALAVGAAALTVFSIYKGVELYNRYWLNQCIEETQEVRAPMVHLYILRRSPLAPSVSIPCTRLETFLRVAKIPYEAHIISDPQVSPNGQLPFVVWGGKRLAGVQDIIDQLTADYDVDIDRALTKEQRATGVALLSALMYSLQRGYMRSLWVERPDMIRPYYNEMNRTPDWLTRFALSRMSAQIAREQQTTGYSKLSSEQFQHELSRDVYAVEALLENSDFLFSNTQPTSYDCALYAFLLPIVAMDAAAEVNGVFEYIVGSEPLTCFVKRMTEVAFPDLDELVNSAPVTPSPVSTAEALPEDAMGNGLDRNVMIEEIAAA